jgi:hypothetical protein
MIFIKKLSLAYALYVGSARFFCGPGAPIFGRGIGGGIFRVLHKITDSKKTILDID